MNYKYYRVEFIAMRNFIDLVVLPRVNPQNHHHHHHSHLETYQLETLLQSQRV